MNGVHASEAVAPPRPPPRFVRLIEDPLPPLEPIRSFEELDLERVRSRPWFEMPAVKWTIASAALAGAVAIVWLAVEFVGGSAADNSVAAVAPPAVADAAATPPHAAADGGAQAAQPATDGAALVARLRAEVERGNAFAENDLGLLYATGRHVPIDEREAFAWFERAAAKGLVSAKFNVGAMYHRGRGVAADQQLAAQWYRRAADEGHIMAQHNLATMYSRGDGVSRDHAAAARLYRQAAEAGFAASQFRLAELYESGLGVKKDRKAALEWYGRAAAQGVDRAQEMVRRLQGEPTTSSRPAAGATKPAPVARDTIRETQRLLSELNFEPGAVDGRIGPQTERAIRDFQRAAGLNVTGAVSPELLEELKAIATTMTR